MVVLAELSVVAVVVAGGVLGGVFAAPPVVSVPGVAVLGGLTGSCGRDAALAVAGGGTTGVTAAGVVGVVTVGVVEVVVGACATSVGGAGAGVF